MCRWQPQRVFFPWVLCLGLLVWGYETPSPWSQPLAPRHAPPHSASRMIVVLQAPRAIFRHQATKVSVQVQTLHGEPLNGIPVEFLLQTIPRQHAILFPRRILTRGGRASAILSADRVGTIHLMVHVGGLHKQADIDVILPMASRPRAMPTSGVVLAYSALSHGQMER